MTVKYEISCEAGGTYHTQYWEGRASEFDKIVRAYWRTIVTTGMLPGSDKKVYNAVFTRGSVSTLEWDPRCPEK
jgi:hypothetical protein